MAVKVALLIVLVCMAVLFAPQGTDAAITCGQIQAGLAPCVRFLQGGALAPQCCPGVRNVVSNSRTVLDRRNACRCIQAAARSFRNINLGNAAALPGRCGVSLPFVIRPNIDCSRIG